MLRSSQGWPFPGDTVTPWAVTPDGRLWMKYDDVNYPTTERGLCWYGGTNVGAFPAPPGGEPQWGGLPHAQIEDMEVRAIPDGYELWMSCVSRGLAVLTVQRPTTGVIAGGAPAVRLTLAQNEPNPFNGETRVRFELPRTESVRLDVFDVGGRLVRRLVDRTLAAGGHEVAWDGRGHRTESLPSGVYLNRLRAGGEVMQGKMLLLR